MTTSRDKYHTKMVETVVDYNYLNSAPLSNGNIRQSISKVITEKKVDECNITLDSHNVNMDDVCQYPVTTNTQEENANTILTSERINNSDVLAETLKVLTVNNVGYYNSDENYAGGDPERDPKVAIHTSDGNKIKVTDTSNGNLQQNY